MGDMQAKGKIKNPMNEGSKEKTEAEFYGEITDENIHFPIDELKKRVNGTLRWLVQKESVNGGTLRWLFPKKCINGNAIKDWTKEDINQWAQELKAKWKNPQQQKQQPSNVDEPERIMAVLWRACELHKSYPPRFAQLVAIWTMLMSPTVIQMKTGEGKTLIAVIEAAFHALQGKHVDVITSSPLLALAAVGEWSPFYEMISLTAAHIGEEPWPRGEMRPCYAADIVYGAMNEFRADFLRHNFHGLNTRGNRRLDLAIVDEADEALINCRTEITMLSSSIPAMEMLHPYLVHMYTMLVALCKDVEYSDVQKCYMLKEGNNGTQKKRIIGNRQAYQAYLAKNVREKFDVFKQNNTDAKATAANSRAIAGNDASLSSSKPSTSSSVAVAVAADEPMPIPNHLREFMHEQIDSWIQSAIETRWQKEHGNYVIKERKRDGRRVAVLVDYDNTGMVLDNMVMSNGLQQFIQIIHSLKISPEGLTTCYISTNKYLRGYASISGMTGTLGGPASRGMIRQVYGLDTVVIPTFKKRQFEEQRPIFVKGKNHLKEVAVRANKAATHNAVLIICKQIADARSIKDLLISNEYTNEKIYMYSRSDLEEETDVPTSNKFHQGDIIIATNLGGRGTDFKLDGTILHVLLTFYPTSLRTEEQAFGRTSRCGQKGTGRMVLNIDELAQEYGEKFERNIAWLRKQRELKEQLCIDAFLMNDLPRLMLGDELFSIFSAFYEKLRDIDRDDIHKLKQVEELWGFEKRRLMNETTNANDETVRQNARAKLDIFIKETEERFEDEQNLSLFTNPCHLIKRGIEFAKQNKNEEAIRHFERAIALDEEMSFMAHYNLAIALLYNFNCVKADEQRRMLEEAQSHLAKSKELINSHILKRWNMIKEYAISMGSGGTTAAAVTDAASDLQRQMDTKIELLNHVINSAEEAIIRLIELLAKPGSTIQRSFTKFESCIADQLANMGLKYAEVHEEINELIEFGCMVLYELEIFPPSSTKVAEKINELEDADGSGSRCFAFWRLFRHFVTSL